ncbi:FAD/NAD(P)-binding protein [Pseudonocardia abyssalis]|uniref:FAD/NAD(P)-binding protein n=1 Tax=Pseudonocardia abyssalis TaxID=2792008 RepID=A0ABS6UTE2_9PSEU|nr:FAD/NAD(P)-binding protein [Pseudonocardia abyssalis]MBW0119419.1 FAD/NAD(P)-binding protein [Pseudonocardia abyssalis]MBW0135529.1 FAD/NAD(P)-binding protein [Pseudonocardia abyssalis]
MTSSIAIVGAGPRGAGVLERLAASAPELHPEGLDVHLIDPYPAGAGRIWRHAQSPLLAMNSMAADVTMFTDDSVVCDGPVVPGPSLWDWVRTGPEVDPELVDELAAVTAATFPSRRLQSAYLAWVLQRVIDGLPDGMRAHVHRTRATGLTEDGETQIVHLDGSPPLRVDSVVLASGHLDATPTADEVAIATRAAEHGLRYLPPEQTTDSDLSVLAPGETVIVRGMGLAFVDLVVLLFEGRGGRFTDDGGYVASGEEPRVVVGSPRGSTYHSKTHYALRAGRPPLPRFFGPAAVDPLIAAGDVDLRVQAWPLMAKEIAWGWYHELFLGHPDAVTVSWAEFAESYAPLDWDSPAMLALLRDSVPDPVDRIDFAALDRPLDGLSAPDLASLQPLVRARIEEDLRQHVDDRHTAHLGAFVAMLSVYGETTRLAGSLSARSRASDMGWWQSFFNSVASGPPGFRVRQLLALSRAGFVEFLGAGMWVDIAPDELGRVAFAAGSATLADAEPVRATALVDARLPDPSAARTSDPLLADLVRRGGVSEDVLIDADGTVLRNTGLIRVRPEDGALVDVDGAVHPRRFAVGPHTTVKVAGAFTRPGMNAQSLRYNDAIARAVLRSLPAGRGASAAA